MHSSASQPGWKRWRAAALAAVCLGALLFCSTAARAVQWQAWYTAQDVRDHLATPQGRQQALDFCRRLGVTKVYLETFRDGYQADRQTLEAARDFFRQAGLQVSGGVATTLLGKPSTGWKIAACYTNLANRRHLESIFRYAAGLFNEIVIDDFLFTDCRCSECSAAKGDYSWQQYRHRLMLEVSRQDVLAPARAVNPQVKIILKFPQWYDAYQKRGYWPAEQAQIYDGIWVGTESRNPNADHWEHRQQYAGYFLFRWLSDVAGAKTGGGWFDPFGTDPELFLDQAYVSVLAGAPAIVLYHYGALISPQYQPQTEALARQRPLLERLSKLVKDWRGIAAYKPVGSNPGGEAYIFDEIGMLGIPLAPTAHFPAHARAALFTAHSLTDPQFVPELESFLQAGGTAFVSEELAHRLNADPRLKPANQIELGKDQYLRTVEEGKGRIVVFSDTLPRLTYVDADNRVVQMLPAQRQALAAWRRIVSDFAPTSIDAPPRVAILSLGGRAAVMNFNETEVAIRLTPLTGMASRNTQLFATPRAFLSSDGSTLHLPPHGVLVVE